MNNLYTENLYEGRPDCPACGARNWNVRSYCRKCERDGCDACMHVRDDDTLICAECPAEEVREQFEAATLEPLYIIKSRPVVPNIPEWNK